MPKRARRGQAIVEFAMMVPIVIFLLVGIVEYSIYVKNSMTVANAAREGARLAAAGGMTDAILSRMVQQARPMALPGANGSVTMEYSTNDGVSYTTLGNGTAKNNAPVGSLIRIRVISPHRWMMANMRRNIVAKVTMRREST